MNLSPLECAVAAKHRVLPVFSRRRPESSPLDATLLSILASIDSKWFTARLTRLESALTRNSGVEEVAAFYVTFRRSDVQTCKRSDAPPLVPLQRNRFGATIPKGAKFLYDPRKQLRSPRCLRIVSGHRELSTDVPGRKPLVLTSALARRPRSSVLAQRALLDRLAGWLASSGGSERPAVSDWASALSWGRDAADGSQEVFLKAFRGIRNFRQGSSLKTWLYRIAIREALNHKRWFKRHLQKNVSIDAQPEEGQARIEIEDLCPTPFEQLAALEIQVAVHGALQQIPDVFRSAVILRDLEGLSYEEVSEVLECSVGTVKSRILRGRRALKEILEPLLGGHQIRAGRAQTSSHGNVSEARPSPFSDAFSAARRVSLSSECMSPLASSTGEGLP